MRRLPSLALLLITAGAAGDAAAFQCIDSPGQGGSQVWLRRCILWHVNADSTLLVTHRDAVRAALDAWSGAACSDLRLVLGADTDQLTEIDVNAPGAQRNTLVTADVDASAAAVLGASVVSLSMSTFLLSTGEIIDADIVINAPTFEFVTDVASCTTAYDLSSILAHELGVSLGFGRSPDPDSTLAPAIVPCSTGARDLSADDLSGLCTVYPAGLPPATCRPPADYDVPQSVDPRLFRVTACMTSTGPPDPLPLAEEGCGCQATNAAPPGALVLLLALGAAVRGRVARRRR